MSTGTNSPVRTMLRKMALVVVLGAIMTILDTTIVNVAVSTLAQSFQTSLPVIQWTLTGHTLALTTSIPITGWAGAPVRHQDQVDRLPHPSAARCSAAWPGRWGR
jgi:MFS family permease